MKSKSGSGHLFLIFIFILSLLYNTRSESKEWEQGVILSEWAVLFYELQNPLITEEGKKIRTYEWLEIGGLN